MVGEILGYSPDTILPTPGWLARTVTGFGLTGGKFEKEIGWLGEVVTVSVGWVWDFAEVRISAPSGETDLFLIQETDEGKIVWQQNPSLNPATYVAATKEVLPRSIYRSGLIPREYPLREMREIDFAKSRVELTFPSVRQGQLTTGQVRRLMVVKEIVEQAFNANGRKPS